MDSVQYVDTFELTRSGLEVKGQTPLSHFVRLIADFPDQPDSTVVWSVRGESNGMGQFFLQVHVKATPALECQRCLEPFEWPVDTRNRLRVVNTEAALEKDDAHDLDESENQVERIVGSRRLDILALIEDEIILSLPYVPKHEICPSNPGQYTEAAEPQVVESRPSPFLVLDKLKKH